MSADNWRRCPKCKALGEKRKVELGRKIGQSYGKVSEAEYNQMLEDLRRPVTTEATLREDWEIGIWDNEFFISYRASCGVCKFSKEFTHKEQLSFDWGQP